MESTVSVEGVTLSPSTSSSTSSTVRAVTSYDLSNSCATTSSKYLTLQKKYDRLTKQYSSLNRMYTALKCKYSGVLRKIRQNTKSKGVFDSTLGKFLNPDQRSALSKRSTRGTKWSTSTVKNGLKLHFSCGPTGYKELLSQGYPLPSHRTLLRSMQHVKFDSGILGEVFHYLGIKVASMTVEERECCLTLDEMSITAGVEFDIRSGRFIGDVSLPGHSGAATHGLVFMLGGIATRWKQTVAYYFTSNATDGSVLADIVSEIIVRCNGIGLNVAAVTSDMGSSNRAMWKKLGIVSGKDALVNCFAHPCVAGTFVYVLADVPHLVKNLRNHIVNGQVITLPPHVVKQYSLPSDTVSVEPLKKLVDYQSDKDLKPAPNLNAKHLQPSHFDKMKVSNALNVFSHSVSAALRLMVETENWDKSVLTTCWFIEVIDRWFNLMSSRYSVMALSLFDTEKHDKAVDFLTFMVDLFKHIAIGNGGVWKPVQTGIVLSTTSVLQLQNKLLKQNDFKFVLTSRFSQDCLENLFSCVRHKNAVPTALEFRNNLRVLSIAQYLKGSDKGSYELDEGAFIADFIKASPEVLVNDIPIESGVFAACEQLCSDQSLTLELPELNSLYYLAGYVLSRIKKNDAFCESCLSSVVSSNYLEELNPDITKLLTLKEYRTGSLVPCSQVAFDLIVSAETVFRKLQHSFLNFKGNVKEMVVQAMFTETTECDLPDCHDIKSKILNRFANCEAAHICKRETMFEEGKRS
jgi:hypothetical protein